MRIEPWRGRHQRTQLDAVVDGHHAAVEAEDDGERTVEHGRAVDLAQRQAELALVGVHAVDLAPQRAGEHEAGELHGQAVLAQQQVEQVGDHLGVGAQGAAVAELLQVAAVDAVAAELAVVHDGPVEQGERVRAAPPAGRVGREAVVTDPGVAAVLLQAEEVGDLLGVADALEGAHVLAGGGDVGAVHAGVDVEHGADHDVVGRQADGLELALVRHARSSATAAAGRRWCSRGAWGWARPGRSRRSG